MSEVEHGSLARLLSEPRETLRVEYKSWLNLKEDGGKAKLAKAAIAMANVGGGTIVIGIREGKLEEAAQWVSETRPQEVSQYTDDDIGAAVGKYADPVPECRLEFAEHPRTSFQHAIIKVFGGLSEPVIAKKPYGKELKEHRCYIRKMGPARSEEPNTTLEWRELFRRCVLAQRETMIDAFRGIIEGSVTTDFPSQDDNDLHAEFLHESRDRWHDVTGAMPQHDPALLGKGHFEIAFSILGLEAELALNDLRNLMREVATLIPSIWFLFVDFDHEAQPVGSSMEAVYLNPNESLFNARAFYYWRVRNDGRFYLVRSYQEDTVSGYSKLYYSLPIWRIGQAIDYAAVVCGLIGTNLEFLFSAGYAGLSGRELFDTDNRIDFWPARRTSRAGNETLSLKTVQLSPRQVEDNLAEIVFDLLTPLYTQFSFYELPREVVSSEIQKMRRHVRARANSN